MSKRREIAGFLSHAKAAITLGHVRWVQRGDETKAHLSGLEITRNPALEHILGLTPDNYCSGPEVDDFDGTDVWVFGCDVVGVEAYIKLTMKPDGRRKTVIVVWIWSFHKSQYAIKYPLRN